MADQTPGNDPLGDRVRATFAAERADIERRRLASGAPTASSRSLKWVPVAVTAAAIAIASFAFIGNRSTDEAVELDATAQTPVPPFGPTSDGVLVPLDEFRQPITPPIVVPTPTEILPFLTGENMCERTGLVDQTQTGLSIGDCVTNAGSDTLDAQPCMRVVQPVDDQTDTSLEYGPWLKGDTSSTADHVHDIVTESNDTCTRVIVTFGDNANEEGLDAESATVPPVVVNQGREFVRISPDGWALETAFMDTDRIDYPGGIGLLALYRGFDFAVELMHREMEPHVRFLSDPARIVIDLFPAEFPDAGSTGPFGEKFVLRGPIQQDRTGPGIPVNNNIVVAGFGRPFEAAGLYRIWAVPDDVDAETFLADPPAPMIEQFFATSGSAEGWGSFLIDLPDLEPGSYIAVFGELPPTDEIGFYGTGQLFRVVDPATEESGSWPEATLLPDVQLPPE